MRSDEPETAVLTGSARPTTWVGYAAAVWAFTFAALSFYWAAGGHVGLGTLDHTLREKALEREQSFITIVWITGGLKMAAGAVALGLVQPWGRGLPRWVLLAAGWGAGGLIFLYGALDLVVAALGVLGVTEPVDPTATRWYFFVWAPVWMVGGALILGAAWHYTRSSR